MEVLLISGVTAIAAAVVSIVNSLKNCRCDSVNCCFGCIRCTSGTNVQKDNELVVGGGGGGMLDVTASYIPPTPDTQAQVDGQPRQNGDSTTDGPAGTASQADGSIPPATVGSVPPSRTRPRTVHDGSPYYSEKTALIPDAQAESAAGTRLAGIFRRGAKK